MHKFKAGVVFMHIAPKENSGMKKGILFSILALMLILNLAALERLLSDDASSDVFSKISALSSAGNKISNISANASVLYGQANTDAARQRFLPFGFEADANSVVFSQKLPEKQTIIDVFYDSINALGILAEGSSSYDGITVDVNAVSNQNWGGTSSSVRLSVKPQCFGYSLNDTNTIEIGSSCGTFDFNSLRRIDVNILVANSEDFNSVGCTFGLSSSCPSSQFDSEINNSYFRLEIFDSNCTSCSIPAGSKTVYGHFNPALSNTITISCVSEGVCTSNPIQISLAENIIISHNGNSGDFLVGLDFNSEIESIELGDFNATATSIIYNAKVSNR